MSHLTRVASLRVLERGLLACFRAPFEEREPSPVFRAYVQETVPMLDTQVRREFVRIYHEGAALFDHHAAAAMGYTLAWVYEQLRAEGEAP